MSNLLEHLYKTKSLINENFDEIEEAKEDRRGQVVDFLTKNPGATIAEIGRAIWGRDIATLGRTSTQVITIVRTIAGAYKAGKIGRVNDKKPHKYYAKTDKGVLIGAPTTSGTPEVKKVAAATTPKKGSYSPEALASMSVEDITRQINHLRQQLSFMPSRSAIAQNIPHRLDIYDDYSSTMEQLFAELKRREQNPIAKPSNKKVVNKEQLLKTIESDLEYFRPGGGGESGEIRTDDNSVSREFRYLGNWIDDEEDGQDEYEDNDQRVWAPGEYQKYFKAFKEWASSKPWFNQVKLGLQTSEKDWCEFYVTLL